MKIRSLMAAVVALLLFAAFLDVHRDPDPFAGAGGKDLSRQGASFFRQSAGPRRQSRGRGGLETLKKIYDEVRNMASPLGQDFLKQDFFIGGPDDDDTNKDVHVVVLIQTADGADRMKIQITYLERSAKNPRVKIAKATKGLTCIVEGLILRVVDSEYEDRELTRLAADILQAVKDKKRLIRGLEPPLLVKSRTFGSPLVRSVNPEMSMVEVEPRESPGPRTTRSTRSSKTTWSSQTPWKQSPTLFV